MRSAVATSAVLSAALLAVTARVTADPVAPVSSNTRTSLSPIPQPGDTLRHADLPTLPDDGVPAPRLRVIVLLAPECPLSRQHVYTLNRLRSLHSSRGVAFVGLFPQSDNTAADREMFRRETGATFALVADTAQVWTRRLGGTITPEAFVLREDGLIVYSGALDDRAVSLGQKRLAATRPYLQDALSAMQAGRLPQPRRVEPVGCFIE